MPQPKKDAVHRYFEFDDTSKSSQCQLCEKKMKGKHTSNLKSHLAVKHIAEYKIVQEINKSNPLTNKQKVNPERQTQTVEIIRKLCMQLVTVHGRPLAMMEDEAFQQLISLIKPSNVDVNPISIKAIKETISEQAYKIKQKIQEEIKHQLVSLKLDSATCTERKFIGVNIQYIKNSQIIVRNLTVTEVTESQTGNYLKNKLEEVLTEFNINTEHIYCICTDNGANMIKLVKLVGGEYFIENNEHNQDGESNEDNNIKEDNKEEARNDVVSAVIASDDRILKIEWEEQEENIENRNIDILSADFEIKDIITSTGEFKIRGMLYAAHTLQLAIKDAISNDVSVQVTINLARRIVKMLRKPSNLNKITLSKLNKPINDCKTRWTATYNMLKRLITLKDFCSTIQEINSVLTSNFWSQVTSILKCLEPANKAAIVLQQNNLTIGDFYITWVNCKDQIQLIDDSFATILHSAMLEREKKLLKNDVVLEGLFLDRRLNLILDSQQCEKAKSLLKETYQQLQKLKRDSFGEPSNIPDCDEGESSRPSTSGASYSFEEKLSTAERLRGSVRQISSLDACLNELLSAPRISLNENIISHWNSRSAISPDFIMLANTVLAAPATQVSKERLFSSLKFILNPQRSNLSKNFLKDLLLVRENKDLLD